MNITVIDTSKIKLIHVEDQFHQEDIYVMEYDGELFFLQEIEPVIVGDEK